MRFATTAIAPVAIMTTVLAYVEFIMAIVMITKKKEVYGGHVGIYVPPAIALLVAGCLQMVFMVLYWFSTKRKLMAVRNVVFATLFFAVFTFGAVVALTVKRHDYCRPPADGSPPFRTGALSGKGSYSDCQGVVRGLMGMCWASFGWNLIFIGMLLGLVHENKHEEGVSMASPVGLIPPPMRTSDKEEEAAMH